MNRQDMDKRWQWRLTDIFKSSEAFEESFQAAKDMGGELSGMQGRVKDDPRAAIRLNFEMAHKLDYLFGFAHMNLDQEASNPDAQALSERVKALYVSIESACSFIEPELLSLPEGTLEALAADCAFSEYDAYLARLLRQREHVLPAEQEKLMAMASGVLGAPGEIYSMLSNVDMTLPEIENEKGEKERMTNAKYAAFIRSRDRRVRKDAFEGMMGAYKGFSATIAAAYAGSVKGDVFRARARRFGSALEMALFPDSMPMSVYDNLLSAVEGALPALNHYLSLRKKALAVDELHLYDLYVSMIPDYDMKMSYPEAFALVKKALAPLGDEYAGLLESAYTDGWIDVYENKSKRSGAYSSGVYGVHPYVLLNHNDDLSGAMTLAHELGHAMHSHFSDKNQPYAKAEYSLFVAEVASTCNEVLLIRHLLSTLADKKAQAYLCNTLLESFRTTVFRQTLFAAFERESHNMAECDEALTAESLSAAYMEINKRYYGGACTMDEAIASEWMRIPHFYRAFYVYKYATGFSAAVAIANRILSEGAPAVRDYFKFLSAGGSVPPLEALKYAGVDMTKPEPVHDALAVFAKTAEDLEKLL